MSTAYYSAASAASAAPSPSTSHSSSMNLDAMTRFINEKNLRHCTLLKDCNSRASQPDDITLPLKEHQLTLLKKCRELENSMNMPMRKYIASQKKKISIQTQFGIGDIGSGKTLSVLSQL